MRQFRTYEGHDMPLVEVLVDGTWHLGDLRMWAQNDDGTWTATVVYTRSSSDRRIEAFPTDRVRPALGPGEAEESTPPR